MYGLVESPRAGCRTGVVIHSARVFPSYAFCAAVACAVFATGCSSSPVQQADAGGFSFDAGITYGSDCFECYAGVMCEGGSIRVSFPDKCETGCGQAFHACSAGCRTEGISPIPFPLLPFSRNAADYAYLCAETPAKHVGDPCRLQTDCLPIDAVDDGDGGVATEYLKCDGAQCVHGAAPVVPTDYLATCRTDLVARLGTGARGFAHGNSGECFECLVFDDADAGCVRTGCTTECAGDQDCPQGSFCDSVFGIEDNMKNVRKPLCRPGPRSSFGPGLSCVGP